MLGRLPVAPQSPRLRGFSLAESARTKPILQPFKETAMIVVEFIAFVAFTTALIVFVVHPRALGYLAARFFEGFRKRRDE